MFESGNYLVLINGRIDNDFQFSYTINIIYFKIHFVINVNLPTLIHKKPGFHTCNAYYFIEEQNFLSSM